jgi:hypothetical protein
MNSCDTKKFYDTEFVAEVHAAKTTGHSGEEFIPYKCGTHWHITHADPDKRRGAGRRHWRCPNCKKIERRRNIRRHKCASWDDNGRRKR